MSRFFSLRRNRAALRALARRLGGNSRGVAAVEFGLILPTMLLIYFGAVELGQGVMIERKVTDLARAVGDLTSRSKSASLSDAEMNSIFDAADTIMMPFTDVKAVMVVSSVVIDNAGIAKVCWSNKPGAPGAAPAIGLARGTTVALPDSVKIPNTAVIMATTSYEFEPAVGYVITGKITINGGPFYTRARTGTAGGLQNIAQIPRAGFAMCPT